MLHVGLLGDAAAKLDGAFLEAPHFFRQPGVQNLGVDQNECHFGTFMSATAICLKNHLMVAFEITKRR